jgi:secreted PhoX family phosphatase
MSKPTVTIKEIAAAAGVSVDTVRRKKKKWELDRCQSKATRIPIAFFTAEASEVLIKHRIISRPL